MNMKKKIIFFDGDGTLWYPKATKRTKKPHWVYHDVTAKDNYLDHLELTPKTKETLMMLHEKGLKLVVISANPSAKEIATREIKERIDYFDLGNLFYSYQSSPGDDPNGKVTVMTKIIDALGFTREDALMIGDSYFYDYLAPKKAGIEALFIENEIAKMPNPPPASIESIKEVSDVLDMLD